MRDSVLYIVNCRVVSAFKPYGQERVRPQFSDTFLSKSRLVAIFSRKISNMCPAPHQQLTHTFCLVWFCTGISRDSFHKRRATGGKRKQLRKKRKFELGRPAANTKVNLPFYSSIMLAFLQHSKLPLLWWYYLRVNVVFTVTNAILTWISSTDIQQLKSKFYFELFIVLLAGRFSHTRLLIVFVLQFFPHM